MGTDIEFWTKENDLMDWVGMDDWVCKDRNIISRERMVDRKPECRNDTRMLKQVSCAKCDLTSDEPCMVKQTEALVASVLLSEIKLCLNRIFNQHWATYEEWDKDPNKWVCSSCKQEKLDVD
jgi:hypothetical protein